MHIERVANDEREIEEQSTSENGRKYAKISFFEKNKKNSKKHLQKVLCYDNINLGHAREIKKHKTVTEIWLHGQAVKTSPFHGGNTGSIPVGVTA